MPTLFERGNEIEAVASAGQIITVTRNFPMARLPEMAAAIEAAIPGLDLNSAAMKKAGKDGLGNKMVPFAVKRKLPTCCAVTVYGNGTIVWAGCDEIVLPAIVKTP